MSTMKFNIWQNTAGVPYGTVLQVQQTVLTGYFTTSSASWVDWTSMSVSITPKFATSKILVNLTAACSNDTTNSFQYVKLLRNGSDTGALGDASGSATRCWIDGAQQSAGTVYVWQKPLVGMYLDSPATTSTVTYKIQVIRTANGTAYFGRTGDVSDNNRSATPSVLTVMEIAA